ncbi:hypothetical protein ACFLYR_00230 [Chloroflexota bacterium]
MQIIEEMDFKVNSQAAIGIVAGVGAEIYPGKRRVRLDEILYLPPAHIDILMRAWWTRYFSR